VPLAATDRTRTALLAAVSHDLRTPLSSAKAAITSLRSTEIRWTVEQGKDWLATAEESLDRLIRLVENLLDVSRLQAGALSVFIRPVGLDEIVPPALDDLGPAVHAVTLHVPDDLPAVLADPALLERVIANLVGNAVRHSPPEHPPLVAASELGHWVELRVVDRGPGIPTPNGNGSSRRSNGWATTTTPPASDWASPSPSPSPPASSNQWAGRSHPKKPPAAG